MAITYHAGRRIQGLERVGSTITYETDFSTNTGWTQVGSDITINSTSDKVVATDVDGTEARIYRAITLSDDKWVVDFDYKVSRITTDSEHQPIALSAGSDQIRSTSQDYLGFDIYAPSNTVRMNYRDGTTNGYGGTFTPVIDTQYYVRLIRDGTGITLQFFTNSARTGTPTLSATMTVPATVVGFTHAQITGWVGSSGSGSDWEVDNLKIYDGVTSVVAISGDVKPTNIQVGSRFEETDTRKMYHYISTSETNQETNSGTGELMNDVEIIAQKFTANSSKLGKKVMSVEVLLKRNTSTIASTNVELFVGVGYPIGSTAVSYGSFTASDLTTDYVWYKFTPTSGTERTLVTNDRIMIRWADGAVSNDSVRMASDQSGNNPLANENGQYSADDGSSWADRSFDYCYKIHYEEPSWKEEGT